MLKCVICGAAAEGRKTCDEVCRRARRNRRTRAKQLAVELDEYRPGAYADKEFGRLVPGREWPLQTDL